MDDRRTRVAKALRGENRTLSWDEISALRRRTWLDYADIVLEAADEVPVIEETNSRLIPDWRDVLKRAHSIKLAALAPIVIPIVWEVLSAAPPELRVFISIPIWAVMAAGAVVARLWKQPKAG